MDYENEYMKRHEIQDSVNYFSIKLYNAIKSKGGKDDNIFFAPSSVYSVLSMLLLGAGEVTAKEIRRALCLTKDDDKRFHEVVSKVWKGIIKANNNAASCMLSVANRLWVQNDVEIQKSYVSRANDFYDSDAINLDFKGDVEVARCEVNKWVEMKTQEKIKEAITPGKLSKDLLLLITNAMYFYGKWDTEFDSSKTKTMPFYSPKGVENVNMMYQKECFGYHDSKEYDCKVLHLAYRSSSLRLMVILPNKVDGLSALENRLIEENFEGEEMWELGGMNEKEVHVFLPKFKMFHKIDLVEPLHDIGLARLFSSDADFHGISKDRLCVSGASHAACIEVNEKGTEIAAYTDSGYQRASFSRYTEFKADHPFIFMIVDKDTEIILFWGRICEPPPGE